MDRRLAGDRQRAAAYDDRLYPGTPAAENVEHHVQEAILDEIETVIENPWRLGGRPEGQAIHEADLDIGGRACVLFLNVLLADKPLILGLAAVPVPP